MSVGIGELLLILVIVFVLFGAGKLPQVMNDIGKGIKGLKKGLKDEEKNLENKTETTLNKMENIVDK
jgi:sec-independent protein translocase protein TatA